ncbi:MAG: 50S ribosomal protein L6 [Parcubacteria group bacterium CG1_02_42_13]|uniref:50S ribosomal protein L6 n=1 Tax=Candidatus Colwellbacteria bacterium CG23_combo_of_CG06-09_8_20_14_all_42_19 TaxID=1974541 RepID=A0A2H0ALY8_9BACT|nr:MAG: 50S ribosomal protein L6 [Parcubacteria group bacterium CG1_02_42_13]PIP46435.1 MAG: 50S ribosomal protein L6 [Candidatus Colwellbacteria bacterium CG23_combo_of_CG06-09_8_20_14_all_42_19]
MSKIGKQPIKIPEGVVVEIKGDILEIKGKNNTLNVKLMQGIKTRIEDGELVFVPEGRTKQILSNWGTMRALTANAVKGVSEDFIKELVIEGVGYRAEVQGNNLLLNVGFSHQVDFTIPVGIKVAVDKNAIKISGSDRQLVGETAAQIRRIKKPEPYKGKGIMYKGEVIRRKAGKKAVSSA